MVPFENLNFWTQFLPFLAFFGLFYTLLGRVGPKKYHNFLKIARFCVPKRANTSRDPREPLQTHLEVFWTLGKKIDFFTLRPPYLGLA